MLTKLPPTLFATVAEASPPADGMSFAEQQRQVIQKAYPTDKTEVEALWGKAFLTKVTSYSVYDAIARTGAGVTDSSGDNEASTNCGQF